MSVFYPSVSLGVLHLFVQLLCVPGICQRKRLWPIWSPETGWVSWPHGYKTPVSEKSPGERLYGLFLCRDFYHRSPSLKGRVASLGLTAGDSTVWHGQRYTIYHFCLYDGGCTFIYTGLSIQQDEANTVHKHNEQSGHGIHSPFTVELWYSKYQPFLAGCHFFVPSVNSAKLS